MSVIQLVGPSTGTAQPYLASVIAHLESLGLSTTVAEQLATQAETLHGTHRSGTVRDGERLWTSIDLLDDNGTRCLMDMSVPDDEVQLWQVPLTSPETVEITATRGTLTVPVKDGVAIVQPRTPRYSISGHEAPPVEEDAPDAPEPPEWYQRTPGLEPPNQVPQVGTIERIGDQRYLCETAQPGGNYFTPGTVGSGWRAITAGEGYDPWDAGTTYAAGDRVTDNGEDWLNRDASNTSRKPGSTAAGWLRISSRPYPYYYLGNAGYPLTVDGEPMQVTDAGRLWQVTQNGAGASSFPPSVVGAGWQDVGPALYADEGPIPA